MFFSYLFHSSPSIFHVSSRTKFCFDTTGATHRALAAWVEGGFSWNTPESMHGGATGTQVVWPRGFLILLPALVPSLFRPLVLPAPLPPCASPFVRLLGCGAGSLFLVKVTLALSTAASSLRTKPTLGLGSSHCRAKRNKCQCRWCPQRVGCFMVAERLV